MLLTYHLYLTTITLAVLGLGGFLACVLTLQDYALRKIKMPLISFLPSIERLEKSLFLLIVLGWILLSIVLISSLILFRSFLGLTLYAKTFLTICAWLVFTMIMLGHYRWGWRGKTVNQGTLLGMLLLVLIYIGTGLWFHVGF